MLTTTGNTYRILTVLVCVSLTPLDAVQAQAINPTEDPKSESVDAGEPSAALSITGGPPSGAVFGAFQLPAITLTGTAASASRPIARPQTLEELKLRLGAALSSKNYRAALEYASIGLTAIGTPEVEGLFLRAKAVALIRLHRTADAIATLKYALVMQPDDSAIVYDIAELLLITGQIDEYRMFESKHKELIDCAYDEVLAKYFSALEAYQTQDEDQFRGTVIRLLASLAPQKEAMLHDWTFDGVLSEISLQIPSRKNAMLELFVWVLMGEIEQEEALKMIKEL